MRRVVIVDDSKAIRDELKTVFQAAGFEVIGEGTNGTEGLDLVKRLRPELVSMDIIMPEMNGVECLEKIRGAFPDQSAIVVSCLGNDPSTVAMLSKRFPGIQVMAKPATKDALLQRIGALFGAEQAPNSPQPPPKQVQRNNTLDPAVADLSPRDQKRNSA